MDRYEIEEIRIFESNKESFGTIRFTELSDAINLLSKNHRLNQKITFNNLWFVNWNYIDSFTKEEESFLVEIQKNLPDDCIREVLKHLNSMILVHLSHYDEQFFSLTAEKLKRLEISPLTLDKPIGIMNLCLLLKRCGESLVELHISLDSIQNFASFGSHSLYDRFAIIHFIGMFTGTKLKRVDLNAFDLLLNDNTQVINSINSLILRGVEVNLS